MKRLTAARLEKLEQEAKKVQTGPRVYSTVFGIVCPQRGHLYNIMYNSGAWVRTDVVKADVYIAAKLEQVLTTTKRFVVVIGGRGSGKSVQIIDMAMAGVKDLGDKVYCLREFQNSLEDSVHSLITTEYDRLKFTGFSTQNNVIFHESGGEFKFKGMARNPASIKSAAGFRRFLVEEAQTISKESLEQLTPTARNKARAGLPLKFLVDTEEEENEHISDINQVQLIFIANPASSADPFSQRFIVPFKAELDRNGFYEDDLHLIVRMNHEDNPWFEESGLDAERQYDKDNLPTASYRHVWEGEFNDHVDNALIPSEWFNACIDAHIKLGFKPQGAKVASHDPSDQGSDAKGYAMRQGSVVTCVKEILNCDAYQGCDTALGEAFADSADYFIWDADGLGATLRQHISNISSGKRVALQMFKGSEGVDHPDVMYSFDNKGVPIRNAARNADVFKNKRAQYYWALRDRFYNTFRAVTRGEYCDPDQMISLDSSGIENIDALRSEVCRIPLKDNNNGYIQVMSKIEMKALKIPSPNMADALMMAFANTSVIVQNKHNVHIPRPLPKMGRR
jgi:phage terminase large subunit